MSIFKNYRSKRFIFPCIIPIFLFLLIINFGCGSNNGEKLAEIAKNSKNWRIRKAALKKIKDQKILGETVKNEKNLALRLAALNNLEDQETLAHIAKTGKNNDLRYSALKKLEDQKVLEEIALNDKDDWCRIAALRKLTNEEVLSKIAAEKEKENLTPFQKQAKLSKITKVMFKTDPINGEYDTFLFRSEEMFGTVQAAARERLAYLKIDKIKHEQDKVAEIAKNDKDWRMRRAAVRALDPREWLPLLSAITKDEIFLIQQAAVQKIEDQDALADIVKNKKDQSFRSIAVKKLQNRKLLSELAKNDKDSSIRLSTSIKLNEKKLVLEIAKNNEVSTFDRLKAAKELKDDMLLAEIIKDSQNNGNCEDEVKKLKDREILLDIAKNARDNFIRRAARDRLQDIEAEEKLQGLIDGTYTEQDILPPEDETIIVKKKNTKRIPPPPKAAGKKSETEKESISEDIEGGVQSGVPGGVLGDIDGVTKKPSKKRATPGTSPPIRITGNEIPKKIKIVNPVYPEVAKRARIQGIVMLTITVDTKGKVRDAKAIKGHPLLNNAAVDAVKQWIFEPYIRNGTPRSFICTVVLQFNLKQK